MPHLQAAVRRQRPGRRSAALGDLRHRRVRETSRRGRQGLGRQRRGIGHRVCRRESAHRPGASRAARAPPNTRQAVGACRRGSGSSSRERSPRSISQPGRRDRPRPLGWRPRPRTSRRLLGGHEQSIRGRPSPRLGVRRPRSRRPAAKTIPRPQKTLHPMRPISAGLSYEARSFPIPLRIKPPDDSWAGAPGQPARTDAPSSAGASLARMPAENPKGVIAIETASGGTPSAEAILARLRSAGGEAKFGRTTRTSNAGFPGWQIDGEVTGRFGHLFVPLGPRSAAAPDSYRLERGERFRIVVPGCEGDEGRAVPGELQAAAARVPGAFRRRRRYPRVSRVPRLVPRAKRAGCRTRARTGRSPAGQSAVNPVHEKHEAREERAACCWRAGLAIVLVASAAEARRRTHEERRNTWPRRFSGTAGL